MKRQIEELIRIINGYIAFIARSKQGANEPEANYAIRENFAPAPFDNPEDLTPSESR